MSFQFLSSFIFVLCLTPGTGTSLGSCNSLWGNFRELLSGTRIGSDRLTVQSKHISQSTRVEPPGSDWSVWRHKHTHTHRVNFWRAAQQASIYEVKTWYLSVTVGKMKNIQKWIPKTRISWKINFPKTVFLKYRALSMTIVPGDRTEETQLANMHLLVTHRNENSAMRKPRPKTERPKEMIIINNY